MRNLSQPDAGFFRFVDFLKEDARVLTAYVFGSYGTERQTIMSDIDIAILFNGELTLFEELGYAAEVSSIFQSDKIDIINLNNAPVYLCHEIIYSGTKIFERFPEKTADFVEKVLEEHHDYEFILKKYREDYEQGLKEEYLNG